MWLALITRFKNSKISEINWRLTERKNISTFSILLLKAFHCCVFQNDLFHHFASKEKELGFCIWHVKEAKYLIKYIAEFVIVGSV